MAIGEAELNRIGEYVKGHLGGWMEQLGLRRRPDPVTNTQLLECGVRVEEELKARRAIMITKFEASNARINDLIRAMDERFNSQAKMMDDRFNSQAKTMDDQFNDIRQSIGTVKWFIVTSFVVVGAMISLISLMQ